MYKYYQKKKQYSKSKLLIPYIHDGASYKMITSSSIPASASGNEYNINMWVYVSDYDYRKTEDKCILFKGDIGSHEQLMSSDKTATINKKSNPSIWLLKEKNTLRVLTGLDTQYDTVKQCDSKCSSGDVDVCDIEHFPLQQWVNINVSLRNNVLDIFLNGLLKKSCIMSGAPIVSDGDLFIGKAGQTKETGFNGYLSQLEYTNKSLSYEEIVSRYSKGPSSSV